MGTNFGLGLILTFTDKASAGIAGAVAMFNNLDKATSNTSSGLEALSGTVSSLSSLGAGLTAAITAPVTAFLGKITSYGVARASFIEDTHLAFTSLMGDAQEASNYMQQLLGFAKTTPYTYEGIANAAKMLISYGYKTSNILSEVDGQYGGILQAVGDWAGATGAGEAGLMAVSEILGKINAEGKIGSMRLQQLQLQGVQAADIIGNMYGMSTDKAMEFIKTMDVSQFVTDLTKGLEEGTNGINGMTGAMAGQMMNLKETWTGAKDTLVSSLKSAGLELMGVYEDSFGVKRYSFLETMTASVNKLSDSIKNIAPVLQPVVTLAEKAMVKGSSLILGITESFKNMSDVGRASVSKLVSGLVLLGPALFAIGKIGGGILVLFNSLKYAVGLLNPALLGFVAAAAGAVLLWRSDFLGIRSMLTEFTSTVSGSFARAKEAVSGGVVNMKNVLDSLDGSKFSDNLTRGFMKLITVVGALFEMWNSNELSLDTYSKARVLGVLPLIEAIMNLKYRFGFFKDGFIAGWKEIAEKVSGFVKSLSSIFKGTFIEDMLNRLTSIFQKLSSGDTDAWFNAGKVFSKIATGLITLWGAVKLFKGVSSIFGAGGILGSILPLAGGAAGNRGANRVSILQNPKAVLKYMASMAIIASGAFSMIVALGALTSNPTVQKFVSQGVQTISQVFDSLRKLAMSVGALGSLVKAFDMMHITPKTASLGIANFAILLGGLELLITAMGAFASIPGVDMFMAKGADTIGRVFDALSKAVSVKSVVGISGITALGFIPIATVASGVANLAILVGGITGLISAFGALSKIPGFDDFISRGGDSLANLFNQIGKIGGSLLGGFTEGSLDFIPKLGTQLADFGTNIKPFFDSVKDAPLDSIGSFATSMGKFFLMLSANDFLSSFTGGPDFTEIGNQLTAFGTAVQPFFSAVSSFDETGLEKAPKVFDSLKGIGSYSFKSGGLAQLITGEVNLSSIGEQLSSFASTSSSFFTGVASFSDSGLEKAPRVFEALRGIGDYDFKTGGLAQLITGSTNLSNIGSQLSSFASTSSTFFTEVATFTETGFQNASKVFSVLSNMGNLVKTGGLAQLGTGAVNLNSIGVQLSNFATYSEKFFSMMQAMSPDSIANSTRIFSSLSALNNIHLDGLNMNALGAQLSGFATHASTFYNTINSISPESISKLTSVFTSLSGISGLVSVAGSSAGSLSSFGAELASFATNLQTFASIVNGIQIVNISGIVNSLNTFGTSISAASTSISTGASTITTSLTSMNTAFSTTASVISSSSATAVTSMTTLSTSLTTTSATASSAMNTISSSASSFAGTFGSSMSRAASSAVSAASSITSALNSILGAVSRLRAAAASPIVFHIQSTGSVPKAAKGVSNFVGGLIQVNEEGGELINLPTGSTVIPHDQSITEALKKGMEIGAEGMALLANSQIQPVAYNPTQDNPSGGNDYSITFQSGSIIVQCDSTRDKDLDKLADRIYAIIKRKLELKKMAERDTKKAYVA